METMSIGIEAPVKVTGTVTDVDFSQSPSIVGETAQDKTINESFQSIPETIGNSTDEWKANTAVIKEFGNVMPEIIRSLRQMNDAVVRNTQNLPALGTVRNNQNNRSGSGNNIERGLLQTINTGGNMLQSVESGNFSGALVTGINGASNTMGNLSQSANSSGLGALGSVLGKASIATAIIGAAVGFGKKFVDSYQEAMPTIFGTGKAFGTTDNDQSMMLYHKVNDYNYGTGLNNDEFNSLIVGLRKQGVGNNAKGFLAQADEAGRIAETTAQWAYKTGGDVNQFANFAGIMSRYGGSKNVSEDFNHVISAGYASGLNDSQIPEFLSGIQKVMEDGIAKGFARSATEVADTMLMFSKLSGNNAFWQGEQGAKLLNQANAGLAGATSMSKTTDLIAFGAINRAYDEKGLKAALNKNNNNLYLEGSNYVNEMMMLEQGLNKDNFGALMGGIYSSTNDRDAQVERIRQMFGLNYTGARRVQDLYDEYKNKPYDANFDSKLKSIQQAPENQNNETKWQQAVNKIQEIMQDKGESLYKGVLSIVEDTATIVDLLGGDEMPKENPNMGNALWGFEASDGNYENIEIYSKEKGEQRAYINGDLGPQEYRNYTLGLVGGDETEYNNFMNSIFSPKSKEQKTLAKNLALAIEDETVTKGQGNSFRQLRERPDTDEDSPKFYIKALYELWKKIDEKGLQLYQ